MNRIDSGYEEDEFSVIWDKIHGSIEVPHLCRAIINTVQFDRYKLGSSLLSIINIICFTLLTQTPWPETKWEHLSRLPGSQAHQVGAQRGRDVPGGGDDGPPHGEVAGLCFSG